MSARLACVLLSVALLPSVASAQVSLDDDRVRAWMNDHHDAARLLRPGDRAAALEIVATHTPSVQRLHEPVRLRQAQASHAAVWRAAFGVRQQIRASSASLPARSPEP